MKIIRVIAIATLLPTSIAALAADPSSTSPSGTTTTVESRPQQRQEAIDARNARQTDVGDDPLYPNTPTKPPARASKHKAKHAKAKADADKT